MASKSRKTKAGSSSKSRKPAARAAPAKRQAPKDKLAGFFRKVWSKPKMMDAFSAGGAARADVIAKSGLSDEHKSMLETGCMRDIVGALAGVKPQTMNTSVGCPTDEDTEAQRCNHADCNAFRTASKNA